VFAQLTLRRDRPDDSLEVRALVRAVEAGEHIVTTGLILQELLQGFSGPKARDQIIDRFASFPLIVPDREDHIAAAVLRSLCRSHGVQVGTIDALLAHLCVQHDLTLLTTDQDFSHLARHCELRLWSS
jgi:predicted nucleic acid-binding protein